MGNTELIANLFRISQTKEKLKRDIIIDEGKANNAHYEIGALVRDVIKKSGGVLPENPPTPKHSLKEIEKKIND